MPIAKVQLPDGRVARFEVVEGTTPEQVTQFANQQFTKQQTSEVPKTTTGQDLFKKRFNSVQQQNQQLVNLGEKTLRGVKTVAEGALEIGPGLGELAVGGAQRIAEVVGREDISKELGERVEKEREGLTTAQKIGRGVGQVIGTLPIGGVGIVGAIKGASTLSALTPTEEGTKEAALKQIGVGAVAGAATFGLFKGIGAAGQKAKQLGEEATKRVKSGIGARNVEQLEAGTIALKEKSSKLYEELRNLNSDINKKAGTKLVTDLDNTLSESGKLNQKLHGDTMSVVKDIQKDAISGKVNLEGLDQHRQNLGAVIKKNTDTISGQVNADGQKATVLIDKLDDLIESLKPSDLGGVSGKIAFHGTDSNINSLDINQAGIFPILQKSGERKGVKAIFLTSNKNHAKGFGNNIVKQTISPEAKTLKVDAKGESWGNIVFDAIEEGKRGKYDLIEIKNLVDVAPRKVGGKLIMGADEEYIALSNKAFSTQKPSQTLKARELLNAARKDWKVYSKFQRIANLAEKADGDPNRIKALFQQFISKKKNLKGFTDQEKQALRFAAANTGGEKLLKTFGKFGFDFGTSATAGNTALPALSLFTGGIAGAPIGGGLAVTGGTVARQLQKLIARGKIDDALSLIEKGGFDEAFIKKLPPKVKDAILSKALSLGATEAAIE